MVLLQKVKHKKKDPYTGGPIKCVVECSMAIVQNMALLLLTDLRLAVVLPDVGKIGLGTACS